MISGDAVMDRRFLVIRANYHTCCPSASFQFRLAKVKGEGRFASLDFSISKGFCRFKILSASLGKWLTKWLTTEVETGSFNSDRIFLNTQWNQA